MTGALAFVEPQQAFVKGWEAAIKARHTHHRGKVPL
jgi:hypothetical protein